MSAPKLKPCPWCGKNPEIYVHALGHYVRCLNVKTCELTPSTNSYHEKSDAIAAWNNRKEPKP